MDELTQKWEDYGLLDGLSEEDKPKLAAQYEDMANFLMPLEKEGETKYDKLITISFPILRRVGESCGYEGINSKELLDKVLIIMGSSGYKLMECGLNCYNDIDCESYLINYIIETYIGKD